MNNSEIFMNKVQEAIGKDINEIIAVLDKNYKENDKDYEARLAMIKTFGYQVFRNDEGKHLIRSGAKMESEG